VLPHRANRPPNSDNVGMFCTAGASAGPMLYIIPYSIAHADKATTLSQAIVPIRNTNARRLVLFFICSPFLFLIEISILRGGSKFRSKLFAKYTYIIPYFQTKRKYYVYLRFVFIFFLGFCFIVF